MTSTPPFKLVLASGHVVLLDVEDAHLLAGRSWFLKGAGYVAGQGGRQTRQVLLHRLIMDPPSTLQVDHRNGDKLDNRRSNLRICTNAQNIQNMHARRGTTSQFKGVSWFKRAGLWQVQIRAHPRQLHLGYFKCELCAARAYRDVALRLHGEFANVDEIPSCECK
jgi:hypothetical protein